MDADIKDRAAVALGDLDLTVSDAVRIPLTRTAREGALPFELLADRQSHDVWFRCKVQEAFGKYSPVIPHDEIEAEFAARRATVQSKLA